jgi:diguanylate cyclase (GGDEF)-like protein/putative nucleotidyltransferase with HDIG domain
MGHETNDKALLFKKVLIAWLFGLVGWFFARYVINFNNGVVDLSINWSFIFPLLIIRAYGPKYALISGVLGLGVMFPFALWPNNGWANLLTAMLYLGWMVYMSFFDHYYWRKPGFWTHPAVTSIPYLIFYFLVFSWLFPIFFTFNPPFWYSQAYTSIAQSTAYEIAIKGWILMMSGAVVTTSLLRINPIRKFVGLPVEAKRAKNLVIFITTLLGAGIIWIMFATFISIFVYQGLAQWLTMLSDPYLLVAGIVIVVAGIIAAELLMVFYEREMVLKQNVLDRELQITTLSNNLHNGMIYQIAVDLDGQRHFRYLSNSVEFFYGITPEQGYADAGLLYERIHPQDRVKLMELENEALKTRSTFTCEVRIRGVDDTYRWSSLTSSLHIESDGTLVWDGLEYVITQQKDQQHYVERLSNHDYLTDLYNRRYYQQVIGELDQAESLPLALIMADVNGLKLINDAFGHEMGDELLIAVAQVISKTIDDTMVAARIGGDEFVILAPNCSMERTKALIDSLRVQMDKVQLRLGFVSVSWGFAVRDQLKQPISELFALAENSMYQRKISESKSMRNEAVKMIMTTLFEKNAREKMHCERVSSLCCLLGRAIKMSEDELETLKTAGLLHDIGKIGVEEYILDKPEPLTNDEWTRIKRHSEVGYQILHSITEFSMIADYVLAHHERIDGSGYPYGLKGDSIPLQARILAIADAYDAMTSNRPYRLGMSKEAAIEELIKHQGTQFDAQLTESFIQVVKSMTI